MGYRLVIGNKNYSSWSMRPWVAMHAAGLPFEEIFVPLYTGQADKDRLLALSPAGKVPILIDGDVTVWDSLAIIEYLAERHPEARLWPDDADRRAEARSISAEMHSGFHALRAECSMNIRRPPQAVALSDAAKADIARIVAIWTACRARAGDGPFLFGPFGAADAMYAPVVCRFRNYQVPVPEQAAFYMAAMEAHPAFAAWDRDARAETLRILRFETDAA